MLSYAELLEVSCYGSRPKDFDNLIHILDSEIRLLTPTEAAAPEAEVGSQESEVGTRKSDLRPPRPPTSARPLTSDSRPSPLASRYYQLTHDYLVHSLRDWLTRKQKETKRGRAELLLADRAGVWNARPEQRRICPPWLQWLNIRWWTQKQL